MPVEIKNQQTGAVVVVDTVAVIGSGAADITVDDPTVSPLHARIYREGGVWYVEDLQSEHGTIVQGWRLTIPSALKKGLVLTMGRSSFEVVAVDDRGAESFFVVVEGPGVAPRGQVFRRAEVKIGRRADNDVVLDDGSVEPAHARIVVREGRLIVVAFKTTNGTMVNGKRVVAPQVLADGDRHCVREVHGAARRPQIKPVAAI